MAGPAPTPLGFAKATFWITLVSTAIYVLAVFIFVLGKAP